MASIFTKIMNNEIPGHFVWQDEVCIAIMTIQPIREGHVLVIPREEIDHWNDLPSQTISHLMAVSKKIADAIKIVYPAKRVGLIIAGLEIPHTHIHLVPTDTPDDLNFAFARSADGSELAAAAERIRGVIKN